jgi:hypothetical protein
MAGLLIYESFGQVYSFVVADNETFSLAQTSIQKDHKVYFNKSDLTLAQLDKARETITNIVKDINEGKEIDVKKELADYFN